FLFFFQAEDGIRDFHVTGVQTCALPISSPSEVENSVTKEIEDAISSLENVEAIKSTSQESFSIIVIQLKQGTDVDLSLQDAQRRSEERRVGKEGTYVRQAKLYVEQQCRV